MEQDFGQMEGCLAEVSIKPSIANRNWTQETSTNISYKLDSSTLPRFIK